jgi:hypothetical protein
VPVSLRSANLPAVLSRTKRFRRWRRNFTSASTGRGSCMADKRYRWNGCRSGISEIVLGHLREMMSVPARSLPWEFRAGPHSPPAARAAHSRNRVFHRGPFFHELGLQRPPIRLLVRNQHLVFYLRVLDHILRYMKFKPIDCVHGQFREDATRVAVIAVPDPTPLKSEPNGFCPTMDRLSRGRRI